LTQTDIARFCGVSLQAYRLWEIGTSRPNPENLKKLEKLLME
jgi:transcriptional regulator with XRE-family HTH domain